MRILAIETSCDETALALVEASGGVSEPKFKVLKNLVHSQIDIHKEWGGVVPNLAKREHLKNLPILLKEILRSGHPERSEGSLIKDSSLPTKVGAQNDKPEFDLIATTVGPGLEPALWTGINFATELGQKLNKPVLGANHLEGHLYSFLLEQKIEQKNQIKFPAIGLLVSGGHTILALFKSLTEFEKLGETRDDAAGEVFDKVARMLGLPYPGGPEIERLAKEGDPKAFDLPRPMISEANYQFSFSGLKTAVLYLLRDQGYYSSGGLKPTSKAKKEIPAKLQKDLSASFQSAVIDVLLKKTLRAANEFGAQSVLLGGGVAANKALRSALDKVCQEQALEFFCPPSEFNTDNAAMIAVASYINHLTGKTYPLEANSNLSL